MPDVIKLSAEDKSALSEIYSEGSSDGIDRFTFVAKQHDGEWKYGNSYLLVVKVEGCDGLWGITVQEQEDGAGGWWTSLDREYGYGSNELEPIDAKPSVEYSIRR